MPLIRLKTTSTVNPTIRKGRRINQTNGKIKIMIRASGQQMTKRMNQSARAINVLINLNIDFTEYPLYKNLTTC